MTDDTRSRWEKWQLYRPQWSRHQWIANAQRRRTSVILPPPSLALTVQDVYPNRVLISVTGLSSGQLVSVTRVVAGSTTRTVVRGADAITTTSSALVLADAEAPFGVSLLYILSVDQADTAWTTVTLSLDKVALSDAISGDAAEVVVLAWPEKRIERSASVFAVGGRNIVVSGQAGGFTGTIDLFVETDDSKNNLLNLLTSATSGILQLRSDQSITSDGVDCYIVALSWVEQRYSQDGTDERRIISMDVASTTSWASTLESSTFTLQDIADSYPGGSLATIAADYPGGTLLSIALGDYS